MRQVRTGSWFGRLTVETVGETTAWCRCVCGGTRRVPKEDLRAESITGCRTCDPRVDSVLREVLAESAA